MTNILLLIFLIKLHNPTPSAGGSASSLYNAALYKPAYQSSVSYIYYPYLGNDGNSKDTMGGGHCQHTRYDVMPWWMVDLKGQFVIEKLVLTNRAEVSTRLRNFTIDIFKTDPRQLPNFPLTTGQICYSQIEPLTNGTFTWQCPAPIVGRFVRLIMFVQEFLHFCELEVYVSNSFYKESPFIMKLNQMLKVLAAIRTVNVADVMTCLQQCFSNRENGVKCTAFNWFTGTGECQLLQINPQNSTVSSFLVVQTGCNFAMEEP